MEGKIYNENVAVDIKEINNTKIFQIFRLRWQKVLYFEKERV